MGKKLDAHKEKLARGVEEKSKKLKGVTGRRFQSFDSQIKEKRMRQLRARLQSDF